MFDVLASGDHATNKNRRADRLPQQSGILEVRTYWEGLRSGGKIPRRSAIDPRRISAELDRVFLAGRVGTGLAQICIAGSIIHQMAGMEPIGLPLSCLIEPAGRPALDRALRHVFDDAGVADLCLSARAGPVRPALRARLVLLPLLDDTDRCTLVLGVFGLPSDAGQPPRRFDVDSVVTERVAAVTPPPDDVTRHMDATADPGLKRHLRLVYSADRN